MAASTRSITPTQPVSISSNSLAPNTPASLSSVSPAIGVKTLSPKSPRHLSPRYSPQPLTGAAAMADERKRKAEEAEAQARAISPNPRLAVLNTLVSGGGMSKAKDAPPATTTLSEPLSQVAKNITIPENGLHGDAMQTSPVSISSFDSINQVTTPTVTATNAPMAGPPTNMEEVAAAVVQHQQHQEAAAANALVPPSNENSNRAFTFPGPLAQEPEPRAPQRNMSLPMAGYPQGQSSPKSPGTKRHKCPYCSTDFTRHHNLKSHLLTHSQEKPYECPTCQARFRRLHDLKRHTKLHTGERPHICPKCGRRFARGDALARHNKGQGGCAGRRSSFGVGEDDGGESRGGDDGMDGLEYSTTETAEPERMDEDDGLGRRVSEPSHRHSGRQDSISGPGQQYSSTYPPVKAMFPPGSHQGGASVGASRDQSGNAPSSVSSHFAAGAPSVFGAQGVVTESPKPLSPGQDPHHRGGRAETANMTGGNPQYHPQQQYNRGSRPGSMGLPPPPTHLPSLPGLNPTDPRMAMSSKGPGNAPAPSIMHQQHPGSNPGSISSQSGGQSSGGSMREIMGGRDASDLWGYIRDLEGRFQRMQDDYEARIRDMQNEINSLKGQPLHQGR